MKATDPARRSAEDLNKICSEAHRLRSEHLRSLVLGWLSRRARVNSELLSSTPKTLCGSSLNVEHVELLRFA
jgi:hypothetical protein